VGLEAGLNVLSFKSRDLRITALVLEPGGPYDYRYDEAGRRVRVIEPNGLETVFPEQPGMRLFPAFDSLTDKVCHIYEVATHYRFGPAPAQRTPGGEPVRPIGKGKRISSE
jgi:YD repeat-containing protein